MAYKGKDIIDVPFHTVMTPRYAPWIMAFMTFLLGVAFVCASTLGTPFGDSFFGQRRLTIEVSPVKSNSTVPAIIQTLKNLPGIKNVQEVDSLLLMQLLEPWVGQADLIRDLPLPTLIDVTMDTLSTITVSELTQTLRAYGAGVRVEEHGPWEKSIHVFQSVLKWGVYLFVLMIVIMVMISILLFTRYSLVYFHSIIETLSLLGAPQSYIGRKFFHHIVGISMKGGVVGFVVSVPILLGARWGVGQLGVPDVFLSLPDTEIISILFISPIVVIGLSILVVRHVIMRAVSGIESMAYMTKK